MGDDAASLQVRKASFDLLDHVEVVENVLEGAVVRETVEEVSNCLLRLHADKIAQPSVDPPDHAAQRIGAQLRPTALTANAAARRPPPERCHGSIGRSCWASAATAC